MEPVVLVILIALTQYLGLAALVGRARGKYGIKAPATTGHPAFERTYRTHQNELENLAVFVPSVWIFGVYVHPAWAAALGALYVVARFLYARGYIAAAEKRGLGAGISGLVNMALVAGGIVGVLVDYLR
jgi:glutathione S-transferase